MTKEEFIKKYCLNGHDPNKCQMTKDLDTIFDKKLDAATQIINGIKRVHNEYVTCECSTCDNIRIFDEQE